MVDTFSCTTGFVLTLELVKMHSFSAWEVSIWLWKKAPPSMTAICFLMSSYGVYKLTSFLPSSWNHHLKRQPHLTTQIHDLQYNQCIECLWFLSGPGWDNMGEIRFVGTGETRGYPFLAHRIENAILFTWDRKSHLTLVFWPRTGKKSRAVNSLVV